MFMRLTEMTSVVGMHRSGTSVTAHLVHELGVPVIGDERFLRQGNAFNRQGYWETGELVVINNRILYHLGGDWRTLPHMTESWWRSRGLQSLKQRARQFLERIEGPHRAWKDPRLSLTLPLWQEIMAELGITDQYVVCLRHPLDVAASLMRRNQMGQDEAIALWTTYTYYAIKYSHGKSRTVMLYESLLNRDNTQVLGNLSKFLGRTDIPINSHSVIQPELSHGQHHAPDALDTLELPEAVGKLWEQLLGWHQGTGDDAQILAAIESLLPHPNSFLTLSKYKVKGWASDVKMRWLEEW